MLRRAVKTMGSLSWRTIGLSARVYAEQLRRSERLFLSLLKQRLDTLELPPPPDEAESRQEVGAEAGDEMEMLLARSLEQTPASGRGELFSRLVSQLVPDEARILAALSEGPGAAIVHVESL